MKRYFKISLFIALILFEIWASNSKFQFFFSDFIEHAPYGDKVGHFVVYGVLAVTLDVILKHRNWLYLKIKLPASVVILSLLSLIEEIGQIWMRSRRFEVYDFLAGFLGIVVFVYLSRFVLRKFGFQFSTSN